MNNLIKFSILSIISILYGLTNLLASDQDNFVKRMLEDGTTKKFWAVAPQQTEFLKKETLNDQDYIMNKINQGVHKYAELEIEYMSKIIARKKRTLPLRISYEIDMSFYSGIPGQNKSISAPKESIGKTLLSELLNLTKTLQARDLEVIYLSILHHVYFKEFQIECLNRLEGHTLTPMSSHYDEGQQEDRLSTLLLAYHARFSKDSGYLDTSLWKLMLQRTSQNLAQSLEMLFRAFDLSISLQNIHEKEEEKVNETLGLYEQERIRLIEEIIRNEPLTELTESINFFGGPKAANVLLIKKCRADIENSILKTQIESFHKKQEMNKKVLDTVVQEKEDLKKENQSLAETVATLKEDGNEISRLKAEMQKLQENEKAIQKSKQQAEQRAQSFQQNISDFKKKHETLKDEMKVITDEKKSESEKNTNLANELENLKKQKNKAQSDADKNLKSMEEKNKQLTQKIESLNKEGEILKTQIEQLRKEKKAAEEKKESLEQNIKDITSKSLQQKTDADKQAQSLQQDNKKLASTIASLSSQLAEEQKKSQNLTQELATQGKLKDNLALMYNEATKQENKANLALIKITQEKDSVTAQNQKLSTDIQLYKEQADKRDRDNGDLQKRLIERESSTSQLTQKLKENEQAKDILDQQIIKLEAALKQVEQEKTTLQKTLKKQEQTYPVDQEQTGPKMKKVQQHLQPMPMQYVHAMPAPHMQPIAVVPAYPPNLEAQHLVYQVAQLQQQFAIQNKQVTEILKQAEQDNKNLHTNLLEKDKLLKRASGEKESMERNYEKELKAKQDKIDELEGKLKITALSKQTSQPNQAMVTQTIQSLQYHNAELQKQLASSQYNATYYMGELQNVQGRLGQLQENYNGLLYNRMNTPIQIATDNGITFPTFGDLIVTQQSVTKFLEQNPNLKEGFEKTKADLSRNNNQ